MKSRAPLISVIMPVFNSEATVVNAVQSILHQSYKNFELIVIDDGSTDQSVSLISEITDKRIRIIRNERNRGVVAVLNDALRIASGEFVARQDADDESLADRLKQQVRVLVEEPAVIAVGAALRVVDDSGEDKGIWRYPETVGHSRWQLLFKTPLAHSVSMYRRAIVCDAGGYSEEYKYAEDYRLWSQLADIGGLRSIGAPLLRYSIGSGGVSRKNVQKQRAIHCVIAQENILKRTGLSFQIELINKLCFLSDDIDVSVDCDDVCDIAGALSKIFEKVGGDAEIAQSKRLIERDCAGRIVRCLKKVPFGERIILMSEVRNRFKQLRFSAMDIARCAIGK